MRAHLSEIRVHLIVNCDAAQGFEVLKNRILESCAYYARKRNNTDETSSEYFTVRRQSNITQLPRYVGNTLDTLNLRLADAQKKLNHMNMNESTWPDLLHPMI